MNEYSARGAGEVGTIAQESLKVRLAGSGYDRQGIEIPLVLTGHRMAATKFCEFL